VWLTREADDLLMMMLYCLLGSSPFLRKVDDILTTELKHLPARYSLTALLNTWVRACVRLSPLADVYVLSLTPPALYTVSRKRPPFYLQNNSVKN